MHLEQTPKTWNFSCKVLLHCFLSVVFWVLSILASSHPLDGSLANASAQRLSDVQSDPNPTVWRMKVDWFSEFYEHHKTCINIFHWLTSLIVYTHLIVYHIHVFHVLSRSFTLHHLIELCPANFLFQSLPGARISVTGGNDVRQATGFSERFLKKFSYVFMQKFHGRRTTKKTNDH